MFFLNNAEELNKLFLRNKDINMLLNYEDRNTLIDFIKNVSKENYSNLLQAFLGLQVIYLFYMF